MKPVIRPLISEPAIKPDIKPDRPGRVRRPRRVGVAEAKSKFSQLLRDALVAPAIIHNRGRDLVVILSVGEYEDLLARQEVTASRVSGGAALLRRLEALKQRAGGGEEFKPARLDFVPQDPFAGGRR